MSRRIKLTLIIVTLLILSGVGTGLYFHETDSKFKYWWGLPIENRLLSARLEIERPFRYVLASEIEPQTYSHLNRDSLVSLVRLGARWIVNMQEKSGRFNYWQNPRDNTFSTRSEDNFLRQAGTNYSLVSAYEITKDSVFLESSLKNLDYLNRFLVDHDVDTAYYMYRRKAKLGGTALPMLVMLKLRELSGDTIYDSHLKSLANMILLLQKKYGTGQYKSTYIYNGSYEYEKERNGWESNIYPGEAMLALTEMYRAFKDDRYLQSIDQAYEYYSEGSRWKHFSFMPWTTIAMSRIAQMTGEKRYADFAFQMVDRILYWQNLNANTVEFGSLFGVPTVFTSTWMEGVGESLDLAMHLGLEEKEEQYYQQLLIAIVWLSKLQYSQAEISAQGYSPVAIGGFRRSLIEPEVRIDNTQHAISSVMKAITYLDDKK